jgi:hypothetical protein
VTKKRYWGLALSSIIWMFIIVFLNAASGNTGTSLPTVLWVLVAFYAIKGDMKSIKGVAKFVSILQLVVGSLFFIILSNDPSMRLYFGDPAVFAIGIGVPTGAWIILYFWSNSIVRSEPLGAHLEPVSGDSFAIRSEKRTSDNAPQLPTKKESFDDAEAYPEVTSDQISNAQILLQHDDSVRAVIDGIQGLPEDLIERVLVQILNNPNDDLFETRNRVILAALGRPDLIWGDELDLIIRKCGEANIENVKEFFRTFPVLSKRMSPMEVFRKLISERTTELLIEGVAGKISVVTQHGMNSYTLQSPLGEKIFTSIEEVYDYLGTPPRKREKFRKIY